MFGAKYFMSTNRGFIDPNPKNPTYNRSIPCFTTTLPYLDADFKIIIYPEINITFGVASAKDSALNRSDYGNSVIANVEKRTFPDNKHLIAFTSNLQGVEYIVVNKIDYAGPDDGLSCKWYLVIHIHMIGGEEKIIKFNEDLRLDFSAAFPYVIQPYLNTKLGILFIDDKIHTANIGNDTMSKDQLSKCINKVLEEHGGSAKWIKTKTVFDYPKIIKRMTDFAEYNNATRPRTSGIAEMYISKKNVSINIFVLGKEVKLCIGSDKSTATFRNEIFSWDSDISYTVPCIGAKKYRIAKFAAVKDFTDEQLLGMIFNTVNMLRAKTQFYVA